MELFRTLPKGRTPHGFPTTPPLKMARWVYEIYGRIKPSDGSLYYRWCDVMDKDVQIFWETWKVNAAAHHHISWEDTRLNNQKG